MKFFSRKPHVSCYLCNHDIEVTDMTKEDIKNHIFICNECKEKLSFLQQKPIMTRTELNELAEQLMSLSVSDFTYIMGLLSNHLQTIEELQHGVMGGC